MSMFDAVSKPGAPKATPKDTVLKKKDITVYEQYLKYPSLGMHMRCYCDVYKIIILSMI